MNKNSKKPVLDSNLKVTIYLPKEQVIKLNRIRNTILEEYNLRVPLSEFLRDGTTDFLNTIFPTPATLEHDIKKYLEVKGLI